MGTTAGHTAKERTPMQLHGGLHLLPGVGGEFPSVRRGSLYHLLARNSFQNSVQLTENVWVVLPEHFGHTVAINNPASKRSLGLN